MDVTIQGELERIYNMEDWILPGLLVLTVPISGAEVSSSSNGTTLPRHGEYNMLIVRSSRGRESAIVQM
jgi:hypothetical protein